MNSKATPLNLLRRLAVVLLLTGVVGGSHAAEPNTYRIGAGDLLSIVVFGEPDLSLDKVRVGTNGTVSFPLLGEISVSNLTPTELEASLDERLRDGYLNKPKITVSILEYRMFYVSGEVKKPGGYNYVEGLTVRKAVALAGGFTVRGSESKLKKIAEGEPGKEIKVDMDSAVGPGDILTVGESFF
ncbi:MAG: polysaccharide export protein [Gammaproteobacteria bacterium]|nr:MAG: polysaccharide export protein [Gammaproteobacteria bacterium]TND07334.1 MAG: polysaccharide export protein [Gammaproteobacteria bacterium]